MLANLTEGVMYMLLVYWLGPLRPLLDDEPSMRWFVPVFEDLHHQFRTLRRNPQAAVDAARQAAGVLDLIHDNRLRALWYVLVALELATDDDEEKARIKDARERILHKGLKMVNASYVDEAAEADLVLTRIDDDVLALLRAKGFDQGTVYDLFEAWREAGRALGESDRERTRIEAEIASTDRGAYARLRADWMKTVKVFRANLSMIDPQRAALLTEKLDEMEGRADARVAARRDGQSEAPEAPAEGDGAVFPADGTDGRAGEDDPDAAELAEGVDDPGAVGDGGESNGPPAGGESDAVGDSAPVVERRPLQPVVPPSRA